MKTFRSLVKRPRLDNTWFVTTIIPLSSSMLEIRAALISFNGSGSKRPALSNASTIGMITTDFSLTKKQDCCVYHRMFRL